MKIKYALMATTAAIALTAAGVVQAQETPSSRPDPAPLSPSASSPSNNLNNDASGGVTAGASSSDLSRSSSAGGSFHGSSLSSASLHELKDDSAIVSSFDMNVKKLKSMDIIGADGKKIGNVDKVLADSSNAPKAVTVDAGGFLGIGGHEVIIGFDQLQKGSDKEFKVAMDKDQIKNLEKYEAKNEPPAGRDMMKRGSGDVATGSGGQPATSIPPR